MGEQMSAEPHPAASEYLVVVGLSQSTSAAALLWAVAEATARGGRVRAVRAWRPPIQTAGARGLPSALTPSLPADDEALATQQLAEDVATALGPDHAVELKLVHGGRRRVLLAQSGEAALLVVNAPHLTSASNSPLGVQRLIQSAGCPVVIVPPQVSNEPDTVVVRAGRAVARNVARSAGQAGRPGVRPPSTGGTDSS